MFESKLEASRRRGRPRMGWIEDVKKDPWEMKVERFRHKKVDREEWESEIE